MGDDQNFRLILLAGFLILAPVGIYHRIKSRTGEMLDRRQEGWFILIALRVTGIAGIAGLIAYLMNPAWMSWSAVTLPVWVRWIGVGIGVIDGGLIVWVFRSLGRNLTDTVVTRTEHTLVTTGPYRWVRHPFYTATALAIPASALATANWFFFAAGALVLLLLVIRTRKEEKNLIARFGDDYRKYMRRTGRFIPTWGSRRSHRPQDCQ